MPQTITYRFFTSGEEKIIVDLVFDEATFRLLLPEDSPRPDWARLEHQQCPNCNFLDESDYCPAALAMACFLPAFSTHVSYEKAVVEVDMTNRVVVSKSTFQSGMASLMGLILATSGCPRTRFLRPMARFHLPFSDERETVFRALSAWLLGQYVAAKAAGRPLALSLEELKDCYVELSAVNAALAERIRLVFSRDAALNAVIILDTFAMIAPENIEGGFEDILSAFATEG